MKLFYFAGTILAVTAIFWFAFTEAGPEQTVHEGHPLDPVITRKDATGQQQRGVHPPAPFPDLAQDNKASTLQMHSSGGSIPADASKETVIEVIQEIAITYDSRELPRIRPFLTHPDPDVRHAALQGMITLGDASAAPMLRAASKEVTDPEEASSMLKAANYLELPPASMAPAFKKKKAEKAAVKP